MAWQPTCEQRKSDPGAELKNRLPFFMRKRTISILKYPISKKEILLLMLQEAGKQRAQIQFSVRSKN